MGIKMAEPRMHTREVVLETIVVAQGYKDGFMYSYLGLIASIDRWNNTFVVEPYEGVGIPSLELVLRAAFDEMDIFRKNLHVPSISEASNFLNAEGVLLYKKYTDSTDAYRAAMRNRTVGDKDVIEDLMEKVRAADAAMLAFSERKQEVLARVSQGVPKRAPKKRREA